MSWKKILIGIPVLLIVIAFFFIFLAYRVTESYIPEHSGEIKLPGLSAKVKIVTDENEIPHIFADDYASAYFALGYLHAGERMFQMDIIRRAGEGRLSEIFGSKTVPFDKMFRTLGLYKNVKENLSKYDSLTITTLKAYSEGINAYINENRENISVEFDLLGYDPEPWKPEESLLIAKMLAWELNISWWTDIAFTDIAQKLGDDSLRHILPDYEENMPTIVPPEIKKFAEMNSDFIKTARNFRNFIGFGNSTHIGSNNWVVNGEKSTGGKPVIANDPHLAFAAPGKWYIADIHTPEYNVSGFTIPGVPAVVIGKNKSVSWVLTNVMADDADFYSETFDSTKTKYLFNGKWNDLQISNETIHVKDSSDVLLKVEQTHRGPVISDIHPYDILYPGSVKDTLNISMRWTALDFSDEVFSFLKINRSENWEEFRETVGHFTVPGQNFVYADSAGNIGYICGVKLPVRKYNSVSFIYDGTTDKYDWKGFVSYEDMPKMFNPFQNFIASANNKTVKNFRYHISNIWEPPSRIKRITQLLKSKEKHSAEDFKKYQMDFVSLYAKEITAYLLAAFDSTEVTDINRSFFLDLLKKWNYDMLKDSQLPSVYAVFLQKMLENSYREKLGEKLFNEFVFVANVPYRSLTQLLAKNDTLWFDNSNTPEIETRDFVIRKSFIEAVNELELKFGSDAADWQWGDMHKVVFKHMFHGQSGIIDKLLDIGPYRISGDGTTIFNTEYLFTNPYENTLGPSMRYIYDFAEPGYYQCILTTGQSGHFMSSHYSDMTEKWLNGGYIKVFSDEQELLSREHKILLLNPGD